MGVLLGTTLPNPQGITGVMVLCCSSKVNDNYLTANQFMISNHIMYYGLTYMVNVELTAYHHRANENINLM